MTLSDARINAAQPSEKPYSLGDGGGLYLLITPKGQKWWRFKYRHAGKEKSLSFGVYPDVPLELARAHRDDATQLLSNGIDPSVVRRETKALELATRLSGQATASVVVNTSGGFEVRKGRAIVCLNADEARAVADILVKLLRE